MVERKRTVLLKLRARLPHLNGQRTNTKEPTMTDIADTPRASAPGAPTRLRLAAPLLVALLSATGCALPFAADGEDISSQVDVSGAEPDPSTSDGVDDVAQTSASTASSRSDQSATPSDSRPVEIDDRFDGRSVRYLGIDVALGDLIVTAQTAGQYLRSEETEDTEPRLLVEVAVTNESNGAVGLPRTVLGVRLASGERLVADEMVESDGDRIDTVRVEAQATERVLLTFDDVDLEDASFEITEAGTIPASIPLDLDLPVTEPYSLSLPAQPAVADLSSPSLWPACTYAWTGEVVGAQIVLEGVDGSQLERAIKGTRWVAIDLMVTNDTTESEDFYPCNQAAMPMGNVSPRLQIDGVSTTETNGVPITGNIEMGAMAVVQFWYRIETDTELIELTDTAGTRIAAWQLDLPVVPGE